MYAFFVIYAAIPAYAISAFVYPASQYDYEQLRNKFAEYQQCKETQANLDECKSEEFKAFRINFVGTKEYENLVSVRGLREAFELVTSRRLCCLSGL